jgi:hypothetical protein
MKFHDYPFIDDDEFQRVVNEFTDIALNCDDLGSWAKTECLPCRLKVGGSQKFTCCVGSFLTGRWSILEDITSSTV